MAAAICAEKKKRKKYAKAFAKENPPIDMNSFVAFAVETSGRLGPEAEKFLANMIKYVEETGRLARDPEFHIQRFKSIMWLLIARGNAQCFIDFNCSARLGPLQPSSSQLSTQQQLQSQQM